MVDEKGEEMDGDVIMALYFTDKIKNDPNFNGKIVATVMSNMGFKNVIKNYGGTYIETKVGDKYVLSEMLKNGAVVGGEQSGHVIYLDKNTTGDGIISAIEMLKIRAKREKPFSELVKETGYKKYPQYLHNVKVRKKEGLWDIDSINKKVKEFEETFKNSGRILIRPSGTEPLIRVMVEAEDMEKAKVFVKDISDIIEKELG
jgi:phosphoglucosamine mutase